MIEETGRVVSVEGEVAWVETARQSGCQSCSASKGCGTSALGGVLGQRMNRVKVLNPIGAKVNEQVVVGLHEEALVRGSLAVYTVPLIAMVLGALLGQVLATEWGMQSADGVIALSGIAGLGLGFFWLKLFSQKIADDQRYQPVILRTAEAAVDPVVVTFKE